MRNLSLALPELSPEERQQIADGAFRSIARLLVGAARVPSLNQENISDWIEYEGFENIQRAKQRGRGALIASGHLGNWDLSGVGHALLGRETMDVVVRPLDNPPIAGDRMIGKKVSLRSLLETLRANGTVGIFVDQNTHLDQGVFVNFFGIPARCGTSFAKLANHAGPAVVPGFAVWVESEGPLPAEVLPVSRDGRRRHRGHGERARGGGKGGPGVPGPAALGSPALESSSARGAGAVRLAGGRCRVFQRPPA